MKSKKLIEEVEIIDMNKVHGGARDTNRQKPDHVGGGRGDIKYKRKEYNKTASDHNEANTYGGMDWW